LQFRPTENRAVTIHDKIASAHGAYPAATVAGGGAALFGLARAGSRGMALSLAFLRSR